MVKNGKTELLWNKRVSDSSGNAAMKEDFALCEWNVGDGSCFEVVVWKNRKV